jgi:ELWxxDGT repeat protein
MLSGWISWDLIFRAVMRRIQYILLLLILASSVLSAQEIIRVSDQLYAPKGLITLNNKLVFLARDSAGVYFWQYDGINLPVKYSDLNNTNFELPYRSDPVEFHNKIYISLAGGQSGSELWRFDGINPPEVVNTLSGYLLGPQNLTIAGNMLYFCANDLVHGQELWIYDEINPPHMVADILPGDNEHGISSNPYYLTAFGNRICFVAEDGIHGNELWEQDGVNPPRILKDINEGPDNSYISHLALFNDKLYFAADDGIHGRELWVYDGTHDPSMISDLYPGSVSSNPNSLLVFMGKLYFDAEDSLHGKRLWSYDETNQPSLVSESYIGSTDYDASSRIVFNDKLYFSGRDEYENGELWEYDGITEPLRTTAFGMDFLYETKPRNFILNANRLYFTLGLKLWSFDGTHQPVPLANVNYNSQPSHAVFEPDLISMNNRLYMISFDPVKMDGLYVLSNAHAEIIVATCGGYEFNGKELTQPGTYIDTIPNYHGADSIITLSLLFNSLDTGVLQEQSVLISMDSLSRHQWIDCDNGYVPIEGETSRIYTANRTGHFAVIVSNGECIDTSGVYAIIVTGTIEKSFEGNIRLYPNPTSGPMTIDLGKEYSSVTITIIGPDGKIVQKDRLKQARVSSLNMPEPVGIYMVTVTSGKERAVFRIVKK